MNIPKKTSLGKSPKAASSNISSLGVGNIIPHWWYKEIRAAGDKPDLVAITVLSELYFLHRKRNGAEFNDGYGYFERKFDLTRSQLKDAIIRLDRAGLAARSFRTIVVNGRNFSNELHLQINLPKLLQLKTKYIATESNSDDNSSASSHDNSSNNDDGDIFCDQLRGNSISSSEEKPTNHISNRKISKINNRSSESNFNSISFLNNSFQGLAQNKADLASFYPLVQSDIAILQTASKRDFTLTAVNEILLKLSKKHASHKFPNKEAFFAYMTKVLRYEMRDAVVISGENFQLNCNKDQEQLKSNRFLENIEYSQDTSATAQLKRKLASVLNEKTAYQFLRVAKFANIPSLEDKSCDYLTVSIASKLQLTQLQKQLILDQARTVFGDHIRTLDIQYKNYSNFVSETDTKSKAISFKGIWGQLRQDLVGHFGSDGLAIDKAWFSKLVADIDSQDRRITLKAPSRFIKEWIQDRYSNLLEQLSALRNYQVVFAG